MGLSKCLFLFFIIYFFKECNASTSSESSYCHDEESSALLQFKESFTISASASGLQGAYPKVLSWKPPQGGNKTNCCTWDGVECDEQTGYVIGLDLRSSCLYGSIKSNSSLFRLVHLQKLDLADNDFNYSQIPTSIRNFPSLAYLDLSASVFSGRLPAEVSQLVKLSLLNLSSNTDPSSGVGLLKLDGNNFRNLVKNLTRLEHLRLRYINIFSTIPYSMANLSFLTTLDLLQCKLFGDFPVTIFHLQNLKSLYVRDNQDLIGHLPEFNQSSRLITLDLHGTRFSGYFPSSIGKIDSLKQLDVAACNFSEGFVPSSIGNLRQLVYLDLSANKFVGQIPESFANLTQLTVFRISTSPLTGSVPSWIGNFSKLVYLDFSYSRLNGSILASFSNLTNLEILYLQYNNLLRGKVEFQQFQNLQNLNQLDLSANSLEFLTDSVIMNATVPQFQVLGLARCNLTQFPYFLRYQKNLQNLYLDQNKIHGQVPKWMWNMSTGSLMYFNLGTNLLSGFEQLPNVLPWVNLLFLSLSSNMFHGLVPVPAASTLGYEVQDNNFSGEVPPGICNMSSLLALDMSNNNFSGMIPQCFGNFSDHLTLLLLRNNLFHGNLPQKYSNKSILRMLDVSHNQLQGPLPRSLVNCLLLETLVLSNNNLSDVFPFWLRTLPELKLLAMRHNGFHGVIGKPENNQRFPKLRVLDMSYNNFTGQFLADYIFTEYGMRPNITVSQTTYIEADIGYEAANGVITLSYGSTITITSKGVDRYYSKIQEAFAVIDISSNKFEGKLDEWLGNLKGLRSLNVSNNLLTGGIPSSLGNLTQLESLDLSNNQLSGEIPQQLVQLTFLAEFDVSHNNLTGHIPSGTQLGGFNVTSYEGNTGLCGDPLPKKCGNSNTPDQVPPSGREENDSWPRTEFDWIFVLAGYGGGVVIGVVLADIAMTRRPGMFLEIAGTLSRLMQSITSWKKF
ncbi:PREDICTED: receptor-like protein 12 [Fragaria vesca subsp. vesca]|uniref:receptor-like protein 12 n=1 Tax=Fragaria vesca subsp. vesca TaxID=101020 RepID=UPI0002C2F1A7|nr:PREDICTED: receptor-like protein 12 [Fragaria vesca subsp. vesca]